MSSVMPRLPSIMRAAIASLGSCLRPPHGHRLRSYPHLRNFNSSSCVCFHFHRSPLWAFELPLVFVSPLASGIKPSSEFRRSGDIKRYSTSEAAAISSHKEEPDLDDRSHHPWAEWTALITRVREQGYRKAISEDGRWEIPAEGPYVSYSELKHAVLNFARDRDDMFVKLPEDELKMIAAAGCSDVERKSVNSAKRIRAHLQISEASACTPCSFRQSCSRAFGAATGSNIPTTQEVVRLILGYAMRVRNPEAEAIPSAVQEACCSILGTLLDLSNEPRDPNLPRPELPADLPKKPRSSDFERRRDSNSYGGLRQQFRGSRSSYEALPGDWRCSVCDYDNFARNVECKKCGKQRPAGFKGRERGGYESERQTEGYRAREQDFKNRERDSGSSRGWGLQDIVEREEGGRRERGSWNRGDREELGSPASRGRGGRWSQPEEEWDRVPSRDSRNQESFDDQRWGFRSLERVRGGERESEQYTSPRQSSSRGRKDSFREDDDEFDEQAEWRRREVPTEEFRDGRQRVREGGTGGEESWGDSKFGQRTLGREKERDSGRYSSPRQSVAGKGPRDSSRFNKEFDNKKFDEDTVSKEGWSRGDEQSDDSPNGRKFAREGGKGVGRSRGENGSQQEFVSRGRTEGGRTWNNPDRERSRAGDDRGYGGSRESSRGYGGYSSSGRSSRGLATGSSRGRGGMSRSVASRGYSTSPQSIGDQVGQRTSSSVPDFWDDYAEGYEQ